MPFYLQSIYGCLLPYNRGDSLQKKDHLAPKDWSTYYLALQEKFANPDIDCASALSRPKGKELLFAIAWDLFPQLLTPWQV